MADIVDSATRSRFMSGIRATNTKPEHFIRSLLHRNGFRFRLHAKLLPGKPDIVLPRYHAVIFVHGCFWHGHDCHLFKIPKTRTGFWQTKFARNKENDLNAARRLKEAGWRVATIWECAIRGRLKLDESLVTETLTGWLRSAEETLDLRGIPSD